MGSETLRIVHLGHVPVPAWHPEAAIMGPQHQGRWVLNHALAQKAAGADVEIIAQAHKASRDFDCEIEGVLVHFLRTYHPYRHFTFYAIDSFRMSRLVRQLHPDIVHAHGTEAAYGWAAAKSKLPFCVTAQGLFFQIIPTLGRPPNWNERFLRWGENRVWKRTNHAIAKSDYVREALAATYPHLDIAEIPNTYEPSLDAPLVERRSHDIAFVGTVDARKGVHILVNAMRAVVGQIPDVRLHLVGNPDENAAAGYAVEQIGALRALLGDRLVLHGKIPSKTLFAILDQCEILVAPSLEEMFGNQLVEGLMRGCHGVVTEGTAMAENVRRFGNGTVVPQRDPSALATAIIQHLSVPPTVAEQESARATIRARMSPEVVARHHFAFYSSILSSSPVNRKIL